MPKILGIDLGTTLVRYASRPYGAGLNIINVNFSMMYYG